MQPIVSPIELGHTESEIPPLLKKIPFIGKLLWSVTGPTKWRLYFLSIKKQVEERGPVLPEVWPSPEQYEIAKKVEDILAESCWEERLSFHPSDPYSIIGGFEAENLQTFGGLSDDEAIMSIEYFFKIQFPEDHKDFFEKNPTFADVVSFIEENTKTE